MILFYLFNVAGIVLSNMFEIEGPNITMKLSPMDLEMILPRTKQARYFFVIPAIFIYDSR